METIDVKEDVLMELSKLKDIEGFDKLLNDYWPGLSTSPASTKFHGAHKQGLLNHCYRLYFILKDFNEKYGLNIPERTMIITAFFHDICKVGLYVLLNDGTVCYNKYHPKGHSILSLEIIQEYIELSELEKNMILYHMGPYGTKEFGERFGEYSLVEMTNAYNNFIIKLFYFCDDIEAHTKGKF